MKPLSVPQLHHEFTVFFAVRLWINYLFANSLWIDYEFTLNILIRLCIYYRFDEIIMNSLWFTQIHFEFTIYSSFFREFTMRLLSIPRFEYEVTINFIIDFEFTIYFANWLWIDYTRFDYDYLSREFTTHTLIRDMAMTLLSISWFDYEFIIYFAMKSVCF